MSRYRIAGVAFEGNSFDYIEESNKSMLDFVIDYCREMTDNDRYFLEGLNVMWVNSTKVIIEGQARLYLIEQLENNT